MSGAAGADPFGPPLSRAGLDVEAATRACVTLLAPMLVLLAVGRIDLGIYASFAAFTGLYGRAEPYRERAVSVAVAAIALVAAVTGGIAVQLAGAPAWLVVGGFVPLIVIGTALSAVFDLVPRGAIFFSFAYLVCALRPLDAADAAAAVAVAAAVAAFSWLIAMSGAAVRRVRPLARRMRELRRVPDRRLARAWAPETIAVSVATIVAAGIAGGLATLLDIAEHHYWAVVTVAAIFSGPNALTSYTRGRHRVIGTLVGVGLAAALYGGDPGPLAVVLVMAACTFVTELVVAQHYGTALAFITPTAIGASSLGGDVDWESLFVDRARETIIGGVVCLAIVFAVRAVLRRRGRLDAADGPDDDGSAGAA